MSIEVLEAALAWHAAGGSVIPISGNGTKKPVLKWKLYEQHRADEAQVRAWFTNGKFGLGVVCGAVSGDLEMLEVEGRVAENPDLMTAIDEQMEAHRVAAEWALIQAGYREWTPSGGIHYMYRLEGGAVPGNTKIANEPAEDENGKPIALCRAETRGEGGYVIVAPSPGNVHPSGEGWMMLNGSIDGIPTINREVRDTLHRALHVALDTMPKPTPATASPSAKAPRETVSGGQRPGDAWADATSWRDILPDHGWQYSHGVGDEDFWTRPGKDPREGISASTRDDANMYIWSSSAGLPTEQPISKLYVLAHYSHGGDIAAAAGQLRRDGWGEDRPMQRDDSFFDGYRQQPSAAETPAVTGPAKAAEFSYTEDGRQVRSGQLIATPASMFAIQRVRWIWQGRAPLGEMTLIPGREGVGKSLLLANLAADLTNGTLEGEFFGEKKAVFYMASEDSWGHTIAPRLVAAGADMDLVYHIAVDPMSGNSPGQPLLPRDCDALTAMSLELNVGAWMFDPIVSLVGDGFDSNKAPELRKVLEPLRRAAEKAEVGIFALVHFNKTANTDTSSKIAGSRAWVEVARAAIAVARMPQEDHDGSDADAFFTGSANRVVVSQIKNNLGRLDMPNLTYEIMSAAVPTAEGTLADVGKVVWGDVTDMTVDQALDRAAKPGGGGTKGDMITNFVKKEYKRSAMGVATQELIDMFEGEISPSAVKMQLTRLVQDGRLIRHAHGMYRPAEPAKK